jgi:hypothetical protein
MLLRHSDGKMRRDGSNAASMQPNTAVAERGRLHGASGLAVVEQPRGPARIRAPCRSQERNGEWVRWRKMLGRLRRQDKANCRSLAPFGRKGLSAHWFLQIFATSKWRDARCAGGALRTFPVNFNLRSDGARNVRRGGAPLFSSPSCALVRFDAIDARKLLCRLFPRPIVASRHVMTAKSLGSGLVGHATVEQASIHGRNRSSSRSRSQSARQVAILSGWTRPMAGRQDGSVQRAWPRCEGRRLASSGDPGRWVAKGFRGPLPRATGSSQSQGGPAQSAAAGRASSEDARDDEQGRGRPSPLSRAGWGHA